MNSDLNRGRGQYHHHGYRVGTTTQKKNVRRATGLRNTPLWHRNPRHTKGQRKQEGKKQPKTTNVEQRSFEKKSMLVVMQKPKTADPRQPSPLKRPTRRPSPPPPKPKPRLPPRVPVLSFEDTQRIEQTLQGADRKADWAEKLRETRSKYQTTDDYLAEETAEERQHVTHEQV